ncbi:MAG: OmpA family protein [Bacteroidota bacterium]
MKWWFVFSLILVGFPNWAQEHLAVPHREVLDQPINSEYTETRPFISFDGAHLYITRRKSPDNVGGARDLQDIYRCKRQEDGSWSEPINLGEEVNTRYGDALACTSLDGKTLYLFDTRRKAKFALWATTEQPDGTFSDKEKVEVADYYNIHQYEDFFVSETHGIMILAIQRNDSRGQQDLYVSERQPDGSYGAPQHMGATINSGRSEFAPYLSPEGDKLYFASYGFGGHGGSDIFYAERLDDSWTNWGRPRNMGPGINTSGQEIYFSFSQDFEHIMIESFDKAREDRDIVQMSFHEPLDPTLPALPEATVVASIEEAVPSTLTPQMEAMIDQSAQIQQDQRERNRVLLASVLKSKVLTDSLVAVTVAQGAEESGANDEVLTRANTLSMLSEWIQEGPQDGGEGRELKYAYNMHFESGSTELDQKYFIHLDRILTFIQEYPELLVTIEGHTDAVGSHSVNMRLSQARAQNTAAYLYQHGVTEERVLIKSMGPAYPIGSNNAENRRIEIAFIHQID